MQAPESSITQELPNTRKTGRGIPKNIPIENIIELKKKNLSHEQIAKLLGCSKANITHRLKDCQEHLEGLDRWKNNRGDILAFHQRRVLNAITDQKLKSAPLNVLGPAFGILYDKERLERGQSTENISAKTIIQHISNETDDLIKRKEALLKELDTEP